MKYDDAIYWYTEAIKYGGKDKKVAVYYSNRALCQLKIEAYGSCIEDSKKSTEFDPAYVKGYFR